MEKTAAQQEAAHADWVSACARITTDKLLFDRLIDASVRDLHALMIPWVTVRYRPRGSPGTWRRLAETRC